MPEYIELAFNQPMSRISSTYQTLKRHNRTALVTFVTAGDPDPAATPDIMHALVRHGADLLELGVPFADPMADGPTIRRAHERALAQGVALPDVLEMVTRFRQTDSHTPVLLMGYLNSIEAFGYETFAEQAAAAGVDGVIIADLPPEEAPLLNRQLRAQAIDQIFLVTPVTSAPRIETIAGLASGFLYYVSGTGTTLAHQDQRRQSPFGAGGGLDQVRQLQCHVVPGGIVPQSGGLPQVRPPHAYRRPGAVTQLSGRGGTG